MVEAAAVGLEAVVEGLEAVVVVETEEEEEDLGGVEVAETEAEDLGGVEDPEAVEDLEAVEAVCRVMYLLCFLSLHCIVRNVTTFSYFFVLFCSLNN